MREQKLVVVKIGGNVLDDEKRLNTFLSDFAALPQPKILVHGGGKMATRLAEQLRIPTTMHEGRRITDAETLQVTVMVYAGLTNKNLVAKLSALGCPALGLCGADANLMSSGKRQAGEVDFGFVGDPSHADTSRLKSVLELGLVPIFSAITHDGNGQLLNTNADTVASVWATSLCEEYVVDLVYVFEKKGVLKDLTDDESTIPYIQIAQWEKLKENGTIKDGMLPKVENAVKACEMGVNQVVLGDADILSSYKKDEFHGGTRITR